MTISKILLYFFFMFMFLGMIVFCLAFGLLAGQMGNKGKVMVDFFVVLNELVMRLVSVVMW